MAIKGTIVAACPNGCEAEEFETWSFVRGDSDAELRESLLAGELNLVLCPACGAPFFPDTVLVYYEAPEELLAFVFPESYRAEEGRWRAKMREDYEQMRGILQPAGSAGAGRLELEPQIFFGMDELRAMLQAGQDLSDETRIAELLAPGLGLALCPVSPRQARSLGLPKLLPLAGSSGGRLSREAAVAGLEALLAANDRLSGFRRWLERLRSGGELPASVGREAVTGRPASSRPRARRRNA